MHVFPKKAMIPAVNKPNYNGENIVNLMQTLAKARGGDIGLYPALNGFDSEQLKNKRNIILFIIDGLGYHFLNKHPDSFLHRHLHAKLSTVTPPTTAAAVTTFLTGLAPQQHGMTGWFTYFQEIDDVVTVLPYLLRSSNEPPTLSANKLLQLPSFFDHLTTKCYSFTPEYLKDSVVNRMLAGKADLIPYYKLEHCFAEISQICQLPHKKYIYAYWPGFDALAHEHGVNSRKVAKHFNELNKHIHHLTTQLSGSNSELLICSDHGFIDSPATCRLSLNDYPDITSCLKHPLCGEPRLAYCYVKEDQRTNFEQLVQTKLGHAADLYPSLKLFKENFFGLNEPHPQLKNRIGDYILLMKENYSLTQQLSGEAFPNMVGYHGGLSEDELYVPLIHLKL